MRNPLLSLPVLALLCSPVSAAVPMPLEAAEAAVVKALDRASSAAAMIPQVPLEFARALMVVRYSDEPKTEQDGGAAAVEAALKAKAVYWASVSDALRAEGERLSDEIDEMSRNAYDGVEEAIQRSMRLSFYRQAAEAIRADIAADEALLTGNSDETDQALIDRKAALAKRLGAMKGRRFTP